MEKIEREHRQVRRLETLIDVVFGITLWRLFILLPRPADNPEWETLFDMLKDVGGSFVSEGRKLLYFLVRTIPFILLFFLGFIFPPIGFIATLLWFFFSAWMLAIEYSDYPMGNHAMRFPDQRQTLKANRMFALGFGTATVAATMIPVVNFFAMPVAVAGSTAMWVDHWKDNIPQITVK